MPEQQGRDHRCVSEPAGESDPHPRAISGQPVAQGAAPAEPVQRGQPHHGYQDRQHAEEHHGLLERAGRRDKPSVDVDAGRQPGLRSDLQVGEDAANLWLLLRRQGPGAAGYTHKISARAAGIGPDMQRATASRCDRGAGRHRGHRVAERHDDRVLVGADEQPGLTGIHATGRQCGQHQAAVGGQRGDGRTGDRDVQRAWRPGYQRGGDLGDVAVGGAALRPEDGRGGLVHRKQRNDAAQQQTRDSRDDGC